jgi:ATP-binding cassette subfamily B protein
MHDDYNDNEYKVKLGTWKKIISVIFKSKKRIFLLIMFSGILAFLDAMIPLLNRYAIDKFFYEGEYSTWPYFVAANLLLALGFGLAVWGFIDQAGIIEAETSFELRRQAFKNLQRLSFSNYDKTPNGWIMARMTSDARRLSLIISWGLVDLVWAFLSMIFILIVLYLTFFKLALIVTAILPIMFIVTYFFRKKILHQHRNARRYNSQLTAQYNEGFLGAKTTKSLSIEDSNYEEFEQTARSLKRSSIKAVVSSALFSSILLVLSYTAVATTMVQGSYYLLFFEALITIGTLQMFIAYTVNFFEPIMSLSRIVSDFQNAQASAERIISLIETEPEIKDSKEVEETYGTLFHDKFEIWEEL